MKEEIRAIIDRNGNSTIKVEGARGSTCLSLTARLEEEIGQVIERKNTGEFYQAGTLQSTNIIRQKRTSD